MYQETILINNEYLKSLVAAINAAQKTIDLEVYIFDEDSVGRNITTALCHAAKRGVKVRVLVDGIGSINWGGKITEQMEACGIKTKVFNPLPWKISHIKRASVTFNFFLTQAIYLLSKINNRNHRKTCIIDNRIVFIGSANICSHLTHTKRYGTCWRETCVKLTNVNLYEIQLAFNKSWRRFFVKKKRYKFISLPKNPTFLLNHTFKRRRIYYQNLIKRIKAAKKRIWVTNAYFVPDRILLKQLIRASQRGIDVRILLPKKSDVFIMSLASATFYTTLLAKGAAIYEYLPTILHAKILVIDDWYAVGSSNLNYRSLKHDLEVGVSVKTLVAKQKLDQQFLADLKQSRQIKLQDVSKQPLYKKIAAQIILLIRYWI